MLWAGTTLPEWSCSLLLACLLGVWVPWGNPGPKAYPLGARMSVGTAPCGVECTSCSPDCAFVDPPNRHPPPPPGSSLSLSLSLALFLSPGLWAQELPPVPLSLSLFFSLSVLHFTSLHFGAWESCQDSRAERATPVQGLVGKVRERVTSEGC